ncbi:MAG: F-box protein [Legionella sp.]|jgi:hypothetical protein
MAEDKTDKTSDNQPVSLNVLPFEVQSLIFDELSLKDQHELISTCKYWHQNFKGLFLTNQNKHLCLSYIAHGKQNEAQALLLSNPDLLYYYGPVRDITGRTFTRISIFQYALWAWDVKHMAKMIMQCLPPEEPGRLIKAVLLKQLKELEQKGLDYKFNGKTISGEKHFDFKPLFEAYKTHIANPLSVSNWLAVGAAQNELPANIRQELCQQNQTISNTAVFSQEHLNRTLKFFNYVTKKTEVWDANLLNLGKTFAIERCAAVDRPSGVARATGSSFLSIDYNAMITLSQVRAANLAKLKQELQESLDETIEHSSVNNIV